MVSLPEREFRWANRLLVTTVVIGLVALVTSNTWRMFHGPFRYRMILFSDVAIGVEMFVGAVTLIAAGAWFYRLWQWLPVPERRSKLWSGEITPGVAVGLFLLPWFGAYWALVTGLAVADAIDRRARPPFPTSTRNMVMVLATLAVSAQLVVCVAPVSFVAAWALMVVLHRRARTVSI